MLLAPIINQSFLLNILMQLYTAKIKDATFFSKKTETEDNENNIVYKKKL
jgi:hypothetical protein